MEKQKKTKQDILFFLLEILTLAIAVSSFLCALTINPCYRNFECFRNLMLGCLGFMVSFCMLILTHNNWFEVLVKDLQSRTICGYLKLQTVIICLFLTLGLLDFFLLSVSVACEKGDTECDEPLLDPDGGRGEVRHLTRTLSAICAIMFVFLILSYWDHFSYMSAHHAWVHAILYCTILGGIFLHISRCLVKPMKREDKEDREEPRWSWHIVHPVEEILDWVMVIVLGVVVMFVWLSAIILAFFTEIAKVSKEWGVIWASLIYCILALILGVTPLAPGTAADAIGGFLIVQIFMHEGYNFLGAIMIAFAFVTVLHFVGSCLQYFIGKVKSVQQWANFELPPDILAASDSVLLDANWFWVGIIGQVFMDTFSGLNQGRMGMDFCTQFWSEYASLPTAFSWVATGAVISMQGQSGYSWASDAIPICLLMAATWQFIGTTFGGYKLLKANKDEKFWKNKEKWETVQYFFKLGVKATKEGWAGNCFCLYKSASGSEKETSESEGKQSLFAEIFQIHADYMAIIDNTDSILDSKTEQIKYNFKREDARKQHWERLTKTCFEKKDDDKKLQVLHKYKSYFVTYIPIGDGVNQNTWRQKKLPCGKISWQMLLVLIAVVTAAYSYISIAKDLEIKLAVKDGLSVLKDVSASAWAVFVIYNIVVIFYYWRSCWNTISSGYRYTRSALRCDCCKASDNKNLETTFSPTWYNESKAEEKNCKSNNFSEEKQATDKQEIVSVVV